MEKSKVKFCVTTINTFDDKTDRKALLEFCEALRDMGAEDQHIDELMKKNKVMWKTFDDEVDSLVCVEIFRHSKDLT
jgi:hypothetical protein